jgi:hypothetical protein
MHTYTYTHTHINKDTHIHTTQRDKSQEKKLKKPSSWLDICTQIHTYIHTHVYLIFATSTSVLLKSKTLIQPSLKASSPARPGATDAYLIYSAPKTWRAARKPLGSNTTQRLNPRKELGAPRANHSGQTQQKSSFDWYM